MMATTTMKTTRVPELGREGVERTAQDGFWGMKAKLEPASVQEKTEMLLLHVVFDDTDDDDELEGNGMENDLHERKRGARIAKSPTDTKLTSQERSCRRARCRTQEVSN